MDQAIPIAAVQRELEQRRKELAELSARQQVLELEIAILERWVGSTEPRSGGVAPEHKLGPAEAVRKVLRENPAGVSRRSLIETALSLVSTDPSKARKTLDQTIRNLLNRDIREENDLLYPMNKNGH